MKPILITRNTLDLDQLRKSQGHKYDHGHALILSGGSGRTGAARLAARAALRCGAGAVTLGVPPAAQLEVATQITAIMQQRIAGPGDLRAVLADDRFTAVCIGPGLGLQQQHRDLIEVVLQSGKPSLVDADALTLIAQDTALAARLGAQCVLTPHAGEFARLFNDLSGDDDVKKEAACSVAAGRVGATLLYKGATTVVADPMGAVAIHHAEADRAVPWLATAGAGDVLAGMITGLMARGIAPFEAAQWATWLHVEAARTVGPGLIAEDLTEALPSVFGELGL